MPYSRFALLSSIGLTACMAVSSAHAQVTVHMTTAQQKSCTATTDANGLTLVPGTTDLQATGVGLSGDGCGTSGSDFQAALNVSPTTVTAGSPVTVTWSAGQPATRCMYTGSTGLTGWNVGAVACQGAQCAQPHTATVTPTAATTYNIAVTCTNETGHREAALTATSPPTKPQPDGFALSAAPVSPNVNTAFDVSWSVTGATSCTGTAKFNGNPLTSLTGWIGTTTTTSPRTVTASQAGTYTLQLACSNTAGTSNSQELTVVVNDPTQTSCTAAGLTRKTSARIVYPNVPGSGPRVGADLRIFDQIWGADDNSTTPVGWPGSLATAPAIEAWGRTEFIAAKFVAPAAAANKYQQIGVSSYNSDTMTMSVSTVCGDFAPANPRCVSTAGAGRNFAKISEAGCPLTPGTEYYINMKYANPSATGCGASCRIQLPSQVGNY